MIVFAGYNRQFTVPEALRGELPPCIAAWDLLKVSRDGGDAAEWADRTLERLLAAATPCTDCEDTGLFGIEDPNDPDILRGLVREVPGGGFESLTADGDWRVWAPTPDTSARIIPYELATDLAEALTSSAAGLVLRWVEPLAWLPPGNDVFTLSLTAAVTAVDESWRTYAIVDELDHGAVLNVIRLAKGPKVEEYTDGGWSTSASILSDLIGVNPPVLVELDEDTTADVLNQIDTALLKDKAGKEEKDAVTSGGLSLSTAAREAAAERGDALEDGSYPIRNKADLGRAVQAYGRAKDPNKVKRHIIKRARALEAVDMLPEAWGITAAAKAPGLLKDGSPPQCDFCKNRATGYVLHSEGMAYIPFCTDHVDDATEAAELAVPGGGPDPENIDRVADYPVRAAVSPDPRAEKLRRYWSVGGKGGLKIRWGLKGDWTRCVRYLRKHLGARAKGYCSNLHKRNTGMWPGSRVNRGIRSAASPEVALLAGLQSGQWASTTIGRVKVLQDGTYAEIGDELEAAMLDVIVAGGFPLAPPDEWFENPNLTKPTPLTVDDNGRVYGHIATFDMAHIGMGGRVHAPRSQTDYAFFRTGDLITASGNHIPVGNITLAGGHAPLDVGAAEAVAHYDSSASAVADVAAGDDKIGIWVAGALRPEVSAGQIRALRASAPSGDWRPINGHLELVAVCQVNVPGFPVARARVASGAVMALVAAGARPLAEQRLVDLAGTALAAKVGRIEAALIASGALMTDAEVEVDTETEAEAAVDTELEVDVPPVTPEDEAHSVPPDRLSMIRAEIASKRRESLRERVRPSSSS